MTSSYTPDHLGTLIIDSKENVTITIKGVPLAEATDVLDGLAARRSAVVSDGNGVRYMVDGYAVITARWEPSKI